MKLNDLLQKAGLSIFADNEIGECEITGISSDSRRVKKGEIFVALQGLNCDGAQYVGDAFLRGAACAISERALEGRRVLRVENARLALSMLWNAWYDQPAVGMKLIGITGTNGKTSTATMLHHILTGSGILCGLIGTVSCKCGDIDLHEEEQGLANMTTPDPEELYRMLARMRDMGATHVVMEVTSHALALEKVAPLSFVRGVFTNLSADHLDFHGDMEEYFFEKRKLFSACEQAVLSYSTTYGMRLAAGMECPFSELSSQTVRDITYHGDKGVSFTLCPDGAERIELYVPVPGAFTVENAGLAALCAHSLGIAWDQIQRSLESFRGVKGRMERILGEQEDISVFLDYAHTPDALEKLLLSARGFAAPHQRIVVLFGCGGDRDRGKRKEMGRIASRLSDLVILTSDNARAEDPDAILEQILRGVDKEKPYVVIKDRRLAISYAIENARAGDSLLLAGKGHEEYEIRGKRRLPFSEREIVAECLARRKEQKQDAD